MSGKERIQFDRHNNAVLHGSLSRDGTLAATTGGNANMQDEGTAIFDLYASRTIRYSTIRKPNFRELKVNFYREVETGFKLLKSYPSIAADDSRFVTNFRAVNLELSAPNDRSAYNRATRRRTVYLCSLLEAGFPAPAGFTIHAGTRPVSEKMTKTGMATRIDRQHDLLRNGVSRPGWRRGGRHPGVIG